MEQKLSVYLNRQPVGTLLFNGLEDKYGFQYQESWIKNKGFNISPYITSEVNDSDTIKRFLSNLLPEGKWLEELSFNNQVSKSNIFGLIALLGKETSGALTFHSEENHQESSETSFRIIPINELRERISTRSKSSIATWDGKQRLSIAGMQEKLPVLIRSNGEFGFGEGNLASTHIMKFNTHAETHMVINEYICMKLAEKINLPAARVSLMYLDEPVLLVERFDRMWNVENVERIHLIDGCQILDLPPTYKYERPFGSSGHADSIRTGASLPKLFNITGLCSIPARARMNLLRWILFQLIIGNCDAHGKNISFFINENGIEIAPAYDMLNIDIYRDMFDHELAMAIGDEFFLNEIRPFQLAEFCEECKLQLRLVSRALIQLCDKVLSQLDYFGEIGNFEKQDEKEFAVKITDDIKSKAIYFRNISKELPGIVL